MVRSTTRRFILCSDTNTEKETWIKNIERIISQVTLKMRMVDSRRVSRIVESAPSQPASVTAHTNNNMDSQEGLQIDKEIANLEKKISDCVMHTNAVESRIVEEKPQQEESNETKKEDDEKPKENEDEDSTNSDTSSLSENEDEEIPVPSSRKRQNTITKKSRRVANLEKMNSEMDKLLTAFTKMNNYLSAMEKEKQVAESEIQELKNHKKLLVKEVKNLREKLAKK